MNAKPTHIAFIMDGNGRWAASRGLPRSAGHIRGVKAMKKLVQAALEYEIPYITVFAFSTENWSRPKQEVDLLIKLLTENCKKELKNFLEDDVKVKFLGGLEKLPEKTVDAIRKLETLTANCKSLQLNICFDYSGRADILQAVNRAVEGGKTLTDAEFSKLLFTGDMPEPDIIVRTGGDMRISNFMLYQAAYSELIFLNRYWPDFNKKQFEKVLTEYAGRERRYGNVKTEENK